MHQPLTIAKVRKETEVTVPAGGWIILVSPEESFSEHHATRLDLAKEGQVNEKYETVACGRLDNKYADLNFLTAAEAKAAEALAAKVDKSLERGPDEAENRQRKLWAEQQKRDEDVHKARVAEANKVNDEIREREVR